MKMLAIYLCYLIFSHASEAQVNSEKVLTTQISEVTVFTQGAQIVRRGSTTIPMGESIIKVSSLSPFVNPNSISVKAMGDFTILSVNHKINYLNEVKKDKKIDSLKSLLGNLDLEISQIENNQEVLDEKLGLLNANKNIGGNNGFSITELRLVVQFYEEQISQIKTKALGNELEIKKLQEKRRKTQNEISLIDSNEDLPTSEIFVKVKSEKNIEGSFEISYPVSNAGWFPKYDIRISDVDTPLKLEYKADVFQHTGIDWKNVNLKLSTADPNESGVLPQLKKWVLNFDRNTIRRDYSNRNTLFYDENSYRVISGKVTDDTGESLPGVNVVIKGTSMGTTTDLDGNYQLTVSGKDELVFSYVGFESQKVNVGGKSIIDLSLGGATELQEVVVTAQGVGRSKRALAYTPSQLKKQKSLQPQLSKIQLHSHLMSAFRTQLSLLEKNLPLT